MIHWSRILDNRWLLSNNFLQILSISSIELRKWKPRFDSKCLKIEKRYNKTYFSTGKHINFSFIWDIDRSYWVRDGCSAIIFVKHVKTVSIQVLSLYTKQCGRTYCCFVVKVPCNAIMQRKKRLLGQNQVDMFYKKLFLCSHPCRNINELSTKLK